MTCAGCGAEVYSATVIDEGPPQRYSCAKCYSEIFGPALTKLRHEEQRRRGLRPDDPPPPYEPPHPEHVRPLYTPGQWKGDDDERNP